MSRTPPIELLEHLSLHCGVDQHTAGRIVAEVVDYFDEPVQAFVQRRHAELQREGHSNSEIFTSLQQELSSRLFSVSALSERQIRRIIYG
ncbi:MAG: hypothetical protein AAF404_22275 [Pseudomonadota bacterium]